jgi:hypothetical protein
VLKEIYCRNSQDPNYVYAQLETASSLEAILTKIRMIIFTTPGDVLGEPRLGLDLERRLFELNFNNKDLETAFNAQVSRYIPEASTYSVRMQVTFVPGSVRDLAYLDIYLNDIRQLGVVVR